MVVRKFLVIVSELLQYAVSRLFKADFIALLHGCQDILGGFPVH